MRLSLDKQIGIGYAQPRDIAWTQTYFTVISNVAKEFLEKQYIKHNETVKVRFILTLRKLSTKTDD